MNQDTICAIATAQGGAIGSIRVSGADAIRITSRIFTPAKSGKTLADCKPYTLTFGKIHDGEEIIDEVLVSFAPRTLTRAKIVRRSPATVRAISCNRFCNCSSSTVAAWRDRENTRNAPFSMARWI